VSDAVLDSSALLALVNQEPGKERVETAVQAGALLGTVNLAEVVAKLSEGGRSEAEIRYELDRLALEVAGFDDDLAYRTGLLRPATRHVGLSLGDRACLALAEHLNLPALTTDRPWGNLSIGIRIEVIR
jgi:PIN domain nuclease of toxin-antitoxin system